MSMTIEDITCAIDYLRDNISTLDDLIHDCTTHGQSQKDLDDAVVYAKQQIHMREVIVHLGGLVGIMTQVTPAPAPAYNPPNTDWGALLSKKLNDAMDKACANLEPVCSCDSKDLFAHGCRCNYAKNRSQP
jgi:hypothetical protein